MKNVSKLLLLWLVMVGCAEAPQATKQPNIIILLADDLGYADLGVHGNATLETPHIDALANQSVQFSNFYVNPICAPSRAALLTGRDFLRTGVSHVHGGKDYIHKNETLLAEAMQINGYNTGMWGKWHSGSTDGYLPWDRGFDEAYAADLYKHENSSGRFNGSPVEHEGWVDSILVNYAIDFIERSNNDDQPFFAYLPFLAPHAPIKAPQTIVDRFRKKGLSENFSTLAAMVYNLDRQVGRLMDHLERSGLSENTIVIFLSDNGPQHLSGFLTDAEDRLRNATDLKGHKGNIWQLGVKSPLFVKGSSFSPRIEGELTTIQDLYPTLVNFAGGVYPSGQLPLDGIDLSSNLQGDADEKLVHRTVFNFGGPGWAPSKKITYTLDGIENEYSPIDKDSIEIKKQIMSIYKDGYKLILNAQRRDDQEDDPPKHLLVNYLEDPSEKTNLGSSNQELLQEMVRMGEGWMEEIISSEHSFAMPTFTISAERSENTIMANAPVEMSQSLVNTVIGLRYWKSEGDYGIYEVDVLDEGDYEFTLFGKGIMVAKGITISVSNDQKSVSNRLSDEESNQIGVMWLEEGIQRIKLQVEKIESDNQDYILNNISHILVKSVHGKS